jgi:septal ring factor EnvC (AmiA/AmiB activator)
MDKSLKIILFIVLGFVVFHLFFDIFGSHSNIKTVISNLKKSQANIDSALNEIKNSQDKLKSMQEDLNKFSLYVKDIQGRVALNDNEKKKAEAISLQERDSLKALIKKGKEELLNADTLPKITVKWK